MRKKLLILSLLTAFMLSNPSLIMSQDSGSTVIKNPKLLRKKGSGSNRPLTPANPNDYLTYILENRQLQVNYPANSLPATIVITDNLSGFTVYNSTASNNEAIDLTDLGCGEYTLTVTLVDNRVYSGPMTIE